MARPVFIAVFAASAPGTRTVALLARSLSVDFAPGLAVKRFLDVAAGRSGRGRLGHPDLRGHDIVHAIGRTGTVLPRLPIGASVYQAASNLVRRVLFLRICVL